MTNALIRPAWTPVTIAMMILGFMIAWPLGLAMIAYILWGDRLDEFKRDVNRATDNFGDTMRRRSHGRSWSCGSSKRRHGYQRSGNMAFDDWRETELQRLDEERRNLENMRREFEEYSRELRRAKDQGEFDRFMARTTAAKDVDAKDVTPKNAKKIKKSGGGKSIPGV